jgi:hypothetical protein
MAHFRVTWKRIDGAKTELEDVFADSFYVDRGTLVFRKAIDTTKAYARGRWLEVERVN